MTNSPTRLFPTALFVAALAPRLTYLFEHRDSPFFDAPVVDARTFLDKAQLIAGGELWGGADPYWQPPLYIYLLAFFCWLLPTSYFVGIRLLQSALGALSCVLVYLLARRAFGERVGRIAGGLSAVCGSFLYFEGELLAVPVEMALNLLLLHQLCTALQEDRRRDWILAGVIAGLAALARPNILLFTAVFCIWMFWQSRRDAGPTPRRRVIWFLLTTLLVILPVTWRNWAAEPDLVFISSNGGINFYIGNNVDYERTVSLHPGMQWEQMAMEPVNAGHETAAAKSSFFLRKGLAHILTNPFDFFGRTLEKGFHLWSGPEIKRNQNIYYAREHSRILSILLWDWHLSVPFGLIGPLSLLGLWLSIRKREQPIALLRLYAACYMASVLLFFPVARYRMPVLPVLIVFAAFGLWSLYLSMREQPWHRTAKLAAPLGCLVVLLNLTRAEPMANDAQLWFDLGEVHLRKGDYALTERYSLQALTLEPDYNYARHNLAVAHFQQKHYQDSEREALATLAENPLRTDTRILLARIYLDTQKPRAAATYLQQALEREPTSGPANYYYGRLLYGQRNFAAAVPYLRKAANETPRDFWLRYELGRALQQAGQHNEAIVAYKHAVTLERRPEALVAIGALHLIAGHEQKARAQFDLALGLDAENLEAHINLAFIDMQNGHYNKTIARLRAVQEGPRASAQAQKLLDEAHRRQRAN